jgi:hypothetical protein
MKSGAFKRALGLVFLYLGLFVVIVLVQFSRGPGLSEKYGALSVSASYPKPGKGRVGSAPEIVRLAYAGLRFEISPKSPAESLGADGVASPLTLTAVDKLSNGVRIKLSPGVEIKATADRKAPELFSLSASAPDGVAALRLRVLPSGDARFSESAGRRGMTFAGSSYDLALGASSLDAGAGLLSLRPGDSGLAVSRIAPPAAAKPVRPSAAQAAVALAPKDPEAFKAEISAWRDKAWSGLATTRLDADKLAWKGPDALPAFSEKALAAYLAESLARGSYSDAIARARGAKEKWPDKLGYLSAPYLGGLVAKMRAFEASDIAERKRLAQLVADKSPTILEKEGLLRFLVDRSPAPLEQDALRYFADLDPAKLTIRQAVGLLACSIDSKFLLKDEENPFRAAGSAAAAAAAAADRIAAAIAKSPSGSFLVTEDDGSTDIRLSLIAGTALASFGTAASKPALVGAGQVLVEGVIGLADAQGFGPARVRVASGALADRSGSVLPEDLYPIVADNPYYPHETSFARDIAPGIWAWTCAPSLTAQASQSRYLFVATFPAGRSHFLSFYGIKPFANIQLYDIDYSPDSEFESYDASGYLYNKDAGALYMKMKHKKDAEDIKLAF